MKVYDARWLTRAAILLALTLIFQMGGFPQPITGPLVNMMLYLATLSAGTPAAIAIGLLTPFVAFARGILAAPLAPAIPFIMAGNALLALVFGLLKDRGPVLGPLLGILAASTLKFLLLASAVQFIIDVPAKVASALQVPQLFTALGGGALAWIVWMALAKTRWFSA